MHQADAGPGVLAAAAERAGVDLQPWRVAERPAPSLDGVDGMIVLGGSADVSQASGLAWMTSELELIARARADGVPLLGLCLGAQLIAHATGGRVFDLRIAEIGWRDVELSPDAAADPLIGGLHPPPRVFQWHHCAFEPPPGATVLAVNPFGCQAFRLDDSWGLQFHPEVTEAIVSGWIDADGDSAEARGAGVRPEALRAETAARIGASSALGAELLRRFARYVLDGMP